MKTLTEFIKESFNTEIPVCPENIESCVKNALKTVLPSEDTIYDYEAGLYSFLLDVSKFLTTDPDKKQVEDLFNILRAQQELREFTIIYNDEEDFEVIEYDDIRNLVDWENIWKIFTTPTFASPKGSGWFGYQFIIDDLNTLNKLSKNPYAVQIYNIFKNICKENNINI